MNPQDSNISDTTSLLEVAEIAVHAANGRIEYFARVIRELGMDVRAIALKTIDVLLSFPSQADIESRKKDVVEQYSNILCDFSQRIHEPLATLNRSWKDVDQALGFYLLSRGRAADTDPKDVRQLIDAMKSAREQIPAATTEIANLSSGIKGSAGGLDGLDDAIIESRQILKMLSSELELAGAVLTRQIQLAERLYELITAT